MTQSMFKTVLAICAGVAVMLLVLACSCGKPKEGPGPESRPAQPDTTASDAGTAPTPQVVPSGGPYPPGPVVVPGQAPAPVPAPAPSVSARPLPRPARPEACWLLRITDNGHTASLTSIPCPK